MSEDIRWKQRFNNYIKALRLLEICLPKEQDVLTDKDRLALIKAYEMTIELSWKMMKDYMEYQGLKFDPTPKNVVREAFIQQIISNGQVWVDALKARNLSAHTYDEDTADKLTSDILEKFYPAFVELRDTFTRYNEVD